MIAVWALQISATIPAVFYYSNIVFNSTYPAWARIFELVSLQEHSDLAMIETKFLKTIGLGSD